MAIPQIAMAAGSAVAKYGPDVYKTASDLLKKATGGKVADMAQIVPYVGKSQQRLTVVADSLIRAGVPADAVFPADIARTQPALMAMREAAMRLGDALKAQFDAGADKVIPGPSAVDAAADVIRVKRVNAVLEVYGTEERYFLCHPGGGVPAADFAYVRAMKKALYSR